MYVNPNFRGNLYFKSAVPGRGLSEGELNVFWKPNLLRLLADIIDSDAATVEIEANEDELAELLRLGILVEKEPRRPEFECLVSADLCEGVWDDTIHLPPRFSTNGPLGTLRVCNELAFPGHLRRVEELARSETGRFQQPEINRLFEDDEGRVVVSIEDMVPRVVVDALTRYFVDLRSGGFFAGGDTLVPDRDVIHKEQIAELFLHLLHPYCEGILERKLFPTYSFVSWYRPRSELRAHIDRDECDWNLSLQLANPEGQDLSVWPFSIDSPNGRLDIGMTEGDAILYPGNKLRHWRSTANTDQSYLVLLFHYNDAPER